MNEENRIQMNINYGWTLCQSTIVFVSKFVFWAKNLISSCERTWHGFFLCFLNLPLGAMFIRISMSSCLLVSCSHCIEDVGSQAKQSDLGLSLCLLNVREPSKTKIMSQESQMEPTPLFCHILSFYQIDSTIEQRSQEEFLKQFIFIFKGFPWWSVPLPFRQQLPDLTFTFSTRFWAHFWK